MLEMWFIQTVPAMKVLTYLHY